MTKKLILLFGLLLGANKAFSQLTVDFHQSNLPFIGFNYEFNDKYGPALRFGIDNYIENLSLEGVFFYQFFDKENYEFYGGAGLRVNALAGIVIPVGLNVFPFDKKNFGVHIEIAPIADLEHNEGLLIRGSWGIRYRFLKAKNDQ